MRHGHYLLLMVFGFISCSNEKTKATLTGASIHKIWKFKKIENIKPLPNNLGAVWIGKHQLDFNNRDTLRFSYQHNKRTPTLYLYKIRHDTVFVQNSPRYKILQLTADELKLGVILKNDTAVKFILVYNTK